MKSVTNIRNFLVILIALSFGISCAHAEESTGLNNYSTVLATKKSLSSARESAMKLVNSVVPGFTVKSSKIAKYSLSLYKTGSNASTGTIMAIRGGVTGSLTKAAAGVEMTLNW